MTKRQIFFSITALVLILALIVPAIFYRIDFEQKSKVYIAAIDATRLEKFFAEKELSQVLQDYKKSGVTTAIVHEKNGEYNQKTIQKAVNSGLNIALAPDVTNASDADLERLVQKYNVKYIKLQKGIWGKQYESYGKSKPVCNVIDKYDLTLVLTEHIMQLGNQEPRNYQDYIDAADGKILRAFTTFITTNVEQKNYPAVYYQMLNSASDRNTRFIVVKQLEDSGFNVSENAERTQKNVRLFCNKMEQLGFKNEGAVNYNTYTPNHTLISAAAAAIAVLMLALMLDLLIKKPIRLLMPTTISVSAIAFIATFFLPKSLVLLYPTVFATLAPCFCATVFLCFIRCMKQKLKVIPLILYTTLLSLFLIFLCGGIMAAILSGPEYFLNNWSFRGVKASLILPVFFAGIILLLWSYKKRTLNEYKKMAIDAIKKLRWYHFIIVAAAGIIGFIYIKRSGNVNHISFTETNIRNFLTEVFIARPRTKDFLLAWPCFTLYIYYVKCNKAPLIQWIFGLGSALLFASSINTFCHTFTMAETMFLRVATGFLFGAIFSAIFYLLNILILKLFKHNKKSEC